MEVNRQLVGAYGCVINSQQEILLIKRAAHDSHPHLWEMPGGGVEFGETIESAVKREVYEETALTVETLYPLATITGSSTRHKRAQVVRIAYLCLLKDNQEVRLSHDHSEYQWVSLLPTFDDKLSDLTQKVLSHLKDYPILLPNRQEHESP